jgi:hypothetical protein
LSRSSDATKQVEQVVHRPHPGLGQRPGRRPAPTLIAVADDADASHLEGRAEVERATGRRIAFCESVGGDVPADLVAFPTPLPTRFRIEADLRETVAFWPDGRVAWRLVVDHPGIDPLAPVDAKEAIVCATTSGHLVVLDPLDRHHGRS